MEMYANHFRDCTESQYLFYSKRKSTFILWKVFGTCYRCHNLTYFNNKVCLTKKPACNRNFEFVKEIVTLFRVISVPKWALKWCSFHLSKKN